MLKRSDNAVVYLAGKITGDPDYRKKFAQVEKEISTLGYPVLNPAVLPEGLDPADYMRICFAMLESADVVVMLPGAEESEGATIEERYAMYINKAVYSYDAFIN